MAWRFISDSITLRHLNANVAFHLRIKVKVPAEDSNVQLHDGSEVEYWKFFAAILSTAELRACFSSWGRLVANASILRAHDLIRHELVDKVGEVMS